MLELSLQIFQTWISEIALLIQGLSYSLLVVVCNHKVILKKGLPDADTSKCWIDVDKNGVRCVTLPVNQLEYLQSLLLKSYRDGAAEVNHIHLEGMEGKDSYDLNIVFDKAIPPLSPEEMKKHLEG